MAAVSDEHLLNRMRGEFMEMPGLRLTSAQVQRLCGVEAMTCELVLAALVDAKFLNANQDGTYRRVTDGDVLRRHALKAELGISQRAKAS